MSEIELIASAPSFRLPNGSNIERVVITLTNSRKPAHWESGGGTTSTGRAVIVTDRHYQRLDPLYVKRKGPLSNANHALLPLKKGYKLIYVWHFNEDFEIVIMELKSVKGNIGEFEVLNHFVEDSQHDWRDKLYSDAVKAGIAKSKDYHCRKPYYINEPSTN